MIRHSHCTSSICRRDWWKCCRRRWFTASQYQVGKQWIPAPAAIPSHIASSANALAQEASCWKTMDVGWIGG